MEEVIKIKEALLKFSNDKTKTAEFLKITVRSLRYKIKKYPELQISEPKPVSYCPQESDMDDESRGEFIDYFNEIIMSKPGYRFANDIKRAKIRKQVLVEFLEGKVRE